MSPEETAGSRHAHRYRLALVFLLVLGAIFAVLAIRQSARQLFALDELTYAHAGWAIAQGELPYRDFFFHHTPLLLQVLAPVWLLLGDDPTRIVWLRAVQWLPLLAIFWALYRLARPLGKTEGLLAPALLLTLWPFVIAAIEIRPDNLAFSLFLVALVVATPDPEGEPKARSPGAWAGLTAGLLVGAAVWASEKVLLYGAVFALGFVSDSVRWFRRSAAASAPRYVLGHPLTFLGGFALAVLGAAAYLALTGSLDDFQRWGVEWSVLHEQHYPGFSWRRYFLPFERDYWWWLPVTAVGFAISVRDWNRAEDRWSHRDVLLLPALVTTFLSFALQTAPMWYSLVPFLGLCGLFTARGVVVLLRGLVRAAGSPTTGRAAVWALRGAALVMLVSAGVTVLRLQEQKTNDGQRDMLATLGSITAPSDPVFDAIGSAVTRPHVSFFFFNDSTVRVLLADRLSREIPEAIVESGCPVAIQDHRFIHQPEAVQEFVFDHFQPYDQDGQLWVWGRPFVRRSGERLEDRFLAVRDGRYFIEPPEALAGGGLQIDGEPVEEPIVELRQGWREISYTGELSVFRLLWLPRDGRTFRPDPRSTRFYWPVRYRGLPGLLEDHDAPVLRSGASRYHEPQHDEPQ